MQVRLTSPGPLLKLCSQSCSGRNRTIWRGPLLWRPGPCGMVLQPATPTPCSATGSPVLRLAIRLSGEVSFLSERVAVTP